MKTAVFTIKDHSDIGKAISYMHTNYTQALESGKPLRVVIDQKEDKFSDAQRRLYWLWMTEYGKQCGLDKEEASAFFKYKYLSIIYNRDKVGEYPETFKVMRELKESGSSGYEPLRQFVSNRMSITEATTKQMVLGQCEKVMFNVGGWRKARQEQQMRDWFGFVPVYLITIDASFCEQTSDREFCALIEHELYHIGVERDAEGEIVYSDNTGLPKHYLAGHDVEEFIGVVKRHGASENVKRLVEVAKQAPFVSDLSITRCCGTCVIS